MGLRGRALATLALSLPVAAWGHGESPRVISLEFPAALGGEPLVVTDTQGLFGLQTPARWLCEDAVAPSAGFKAVVFGPPMVVATEQGVHVSHDDGCTFVPATGLPPGSPAIALSAHPERPLEVLTATAGGEESPSGGSDFVDGAFLSEDGGATFQATDLVETGAFHSLVRVPDAPEQVFASGDGGLFKSLDGGRTFSRLTLQVPDEVIKDESVYFLPGPPGGLEVWLAVQRVPQTLVLRSRDGGETFEPVLSVGDPVSSVAFDSTGRRVRLSTIFGTVHASEDGGETFTGGAASEPGFGCLVRAPGTDRLYACADAFQGATYTVAVSDDWATFSPVLTAFQDVRHRWACPEDSPATQACADVCPGEAVGAVCALCPEAEGCEAPPLPDAASPLPDAASPPPDALSVVDTAGSTDVAPPDATASPDAQVVAAATVRPGTCESAPGPAPGLAALWGVALIGLARRSRPRAGRAAHCPACPPASDTASRRNPS